jgi:tetratricopeptide (TPR) repeat protein
MSRNYFFTIVFLIFCSCINAQPFDYEDSLKTFPNLNAKSSEKSSEDYMYIAIGHFDGKRYEQCLKNLDMAIQINDNETLTDILYYYRAVTFVQLEMDSMAILQLDSAILFNRKKVKYLSLRGDLHIKTEQWDKAIADFQSILELDPSNEPARLQTGAALQKKGQFKEALLTYDEIIKNNPQSADAYRLKGLLYLQAAVPDKGCEFLKKAAELGSESARESAIRYCK